jgi:hypothetical protein
MGQTDEKIKSGLLKNIFRNIITKSKPWCYDASIPRGGENIEGLAAANFRNYPRME